MVSPKSLVSSLHLLVKSNLLTAEQEQHLVNHGVTSVEELLALFALSPDMEVSLTKLLEISDTELSEIVVSARKWVSDKNLAYIDQHRHQAYPMGAILNKEQVENGGDNRSDNSSTLNEDDSCKRVEQDDDIC